MLIGGIYNFKEEVDEMEVIQIQEKVEEVEGQTGLQTGSLESIGEMGIQEPENENTFHPFYKCPFCFNVYANAYWLKQHLLVHWEDINLLKTTSEATITEKKNPTPLKCRKSRKMSKLLTCKVMVTRSNSQQLISSASPSETTGPSLESKFADQIVSTEASPSLEGIEPTRNRRSKRISERKPPGCGTSKVPSSAWCHARNDLVLDPKQETGYEKMLESLPPCWISLARCDQKPTNCIELLPKKTEGEELTVPRVSYLPTDKSVKVNRQRPLNSRVSGKFNCTICFKTFSDRHRLEFHSYTHTKEKNYKCPVCPKSFTQPGNVNLHIRTHTLETPYKCKSCSRAFKQLSQLQHHLPTHQVLKPYQCKMCPKTFSQKFNLKLHILTHGGVKSYKCQTCSKVFGRPGALKNHSRVHSLEYTYKCSMCSYGYATGRGLRLHFLKVHNDKD